MKPQQEIVVNRAKSLRSACESLISAVELEYAKPALVEHLRLEIDDLQCKLDQDLRELRQSLTV